MFPSPVPDKYSVSVFCAFVTVAHKQLADKKLFYSFYYHIRYVGYKLFIPFDREHIKFTVRLKVEHPLVYYDVLVQRFDCQRVLAFFK